MISHLTNLKRFLRDSAGNISISFGLMLIPTIGAVGIAIDMNKALQSKTVMQEVADNAALAGASLVTGNKQAREDAANAFLTANETTTGLTILTKSVVANTTDNTVTVAITAKTKTTMSNAMLTNLVGDKAFEIALTSIAVGAQPNNGEACILALSPTGTGVGVGGSSTVSVDGCRVAANSSDASAINRFGASTLKAACLVAVGGVTGAVPVDISCPETKVTGASAAADPYASLPALAKPSGPCRTVDVKNNKSDTLVPTECYNSVNISNGGTLNISPGNIYIEGAFGSTGGTIQSVSSGSTIGNMIYVKSGAVSLNGNGTTKIQPATSGDYKGVSFYQPPTNTNMLKFNGTASSSLQGVVYAPSAEIQMNGNFNTATKLCLQMVANTIDLKGNLSLKSTCTDLGMSTIGLKGEAKVRLTYKP